MKKKYIFALAAGIALLAIGLFYRHEIPTKANSAVRIAKTEISHASAAAPPLHPHGQKIAPTLSSANSQTSKGRPNLGITFQTTSNYKSFIEEALKHPELGGTYFAYRAIFICGVSMGFDGSATFELQPEAKLNAEQGKKELAAHNRLVTICQGMTKDDMRKERVRTIFDDAKKLGDPLMPASVNSPTSYSAVGEERKALLNNLFGVADTAVSASDNFNVLATKKEGEDNLVVYYAGKWLAGADFGEVMMGWQLVGCQFGLDCENGINDNELAYICATTGRCADNRYALYLDILFEGDKSRFDKAIAYSVSMANDIRKKNVDAFVPPK
jgi:hypothetical protein